MKRNPFYQLTYFSGIPHLIPFGQANADFRPCLMLNESGAFLWEHADEADTIEQLIALTRSHYACAESNILETEHTLRTFLDVLFEKGLLLSETAHSTAPSCKLLEIAGLFCRMHGDMAPVAKELLSFKTDAIPPIDAPLLELRLLSSSPTDTPCGKMILQNGELCVLDTDDQFILLYPSSLHVREARISRDGRFASIYYSPTADTGLQTDILYTVRTLFLYFAGLHGILTIHSASILYQDKAWLFSGPSGVGKSTHTNLWKRLLDVPVLNGDLNLIAIQDGTPIVYGSPWCGTSGIYCKDTFSLGGVIFLQQGQADRTYTLSDDQKQLRLNNRCISPNWTTEMLTKNLSTVREIYPHIFLGCLICTPTENAVHCIRNAIDTYLLSEQPE